MQDRFKFRTYIPDKKFFKFWGWISKGQYKGLCSSGENSLDELLEKYTNQCTGLKDKNGKLIYEGDIVKLYNQKYKIIYEQRGAYFGLYISKNETYYLNDINTQTSNMEIIGNIYENPELLESEEQQHE